MLEKSGRHSYEGPLKEEALRQNTKTTLVTSCGPRWLARTRREDLCVNNMYKLGDTNLTPKIGVDAGKVWNTVARQWEMDISTIARVAQIPRVDAYQALGWLAREKQGTVTKNKIKNQDQSSFE